MDCRPVPDPNLSSDTTPHVGIVIVNWNKKNDLLRLLSSLETLNYSSADIIVIDNASDDGTADEVRKRFPKAVLLVNDVNLGGTGGFNTGLEYCRETGYDYIWLLDNDAGITPNALSYMVGVAESDLTIGVVGSKILNSEDPAFIVKLGANIDWTRGLVRSISQNVRDCASSEDSTDVDYVPFCSALIRRSCLLDTGGLDERFFLYWDDTDFCLRAKRYGYKTVVATKSVVYHPSFTEKSRNFNYYLIRNTLLFFAKHLPLLLMIRTFYHVLGRFIKNMVFAHLIGDVRSSTLFARGLTDFLRCRFGKEIAVPSLHAVKILSRPLLPIEIQGKKLLITYEGSADVMKLAFDHLPDNVKEATTILMPLSRADLCVGHSTHIMTLDDRTNNLFFEHLRIFFNIIRQRFDTVVTTHCTMSPFAFAASRTYYFDSNSLVFIQVPLSRWKLPLLVMSIISSYLLTIVALPFFWCVGVLLSRQQYSKEFDIASGFSK